MATFITGDKHGDLTEILNFIKKGGNCNSKLNFSINKF